MLSVSALMLGGALLGGCANPGAIAIAPATAATPTGPDSVVPSDGNYAGRTGYQVQYADYLAWRRTKPADLVFIGDSITEQFRWGEGNQVWMQHYEKRALNFGRSGDRTQHVLWRLDNLDIGWAKPKVAVLLIGTNNVPNTPQEIATGVKAVIAKTQAKWPGIKVILLSILPTARESDKMAAVNPLLAPLADQKTVFYVDLGAQFPREGDNWKGLQKDKLHLSRVGYEAWAKTLNAVLPAILK